MKLTTTYGRKDRTKPDPVSSPTVVQSSENVTKKRKHSLAFTKPSVSKDRLTNNQIRQSSGSISTADPSRNARDGELVSSEPGFSSNRATSGVTRVGIAKTQATPASPTPKDGRDKHKETSRRPRLIDSLVSTTDESHPVEAQTAVESSSHHSSRRSPSQNDSISANLHPKPKPPTLSTPKSRKIKYTYSQVRSAISDNPTAEAADESDYDGMLEEELAEPSKTTPPLSENLGYDDFDDDLDAKVAIQSVHELRRAGANNRFADEMADLVSRIGKPGRQSVATRRTAMSELAHKLQRKDFSNQFLDHTARDQVARAAGDESDITTAFSLVTVLIIILSSGPAPHLSQQLIDDRIGKLLSRMLCEREDILVTISQQTQTSRSTRKYVSSAVSLLRNKTIWHGAAVTTFSPCTVALQLMDMLAQQPDLLQLDKTVLDIDQNLLVVAGQLAQNASREDIHLVLTISILEALCGKSAYAGTNILTASLQQSPTIHSLLHSTLSRWPEERGQLERNTFKLAMNVTNTEEGAANCGDKATLMYLFECILKGFACNQEDVKSGHLRDGIYEGLLLVLGLTINILEHHPPARYAHSEKSINRLTALWSENQILVNEADSVDSSRLSVAFGYLAVLLGYLSLAENNLTDINGLISSIQEFVNMYRNVDNKVPEMEILVGELRKRKP